MNDNGDSSFTPEQASLAASAADLAAGDIVAVDNGVLTRVHPAHVCASTACWIHNPSTHHMTEWPIRWCADKGTAERRCEHGIGHPDPDDAAHHALAGRDVLAHRCDGCCAQ